MPATVLKLWFAVFLVRDACVFVGLLTGCRPLELRDHKRSDLLFPCPGLSGDDDGAYAPRHAPFYLDISPLYFIIAIIFPENP